MARQRHVKRRLTERQRLYALLRVALRDLQQQAPQLWTEDHYRDLLRRHGASDHGGRPSASTMSYQQIEAALAEMRAAGWQSTAGPELSIVHRCAPELSGQWRKITALWCALADAGTIRDRSEAAMLAWCDRHIRADRREWASAQDLGTCIEALKSWAARDGVSDG
jgi:hypothetical protein